MVRPLSVIVAPRPVRSDSHDMTYYPQGSTIITHGNYDSGCFSTCSPRCLAIGTQLVAYAQQCYEYAWLQQDDPLFLLAYKLIHFSHTK